MSVLDAVRSLLTLQQQQPERQLQVTWPDLQTQLDTTVAIRASVQAQRIWRRPTVAEALEVPAIQRAVALIASQMGSLAMLGYRDQVRMTDPPQLVVRPDPDLTPAAFWGQAGYNMATRGEVVMWIATRNGDGLASALVNVPLLELEVDGTGRDRRYPLYRWGDRTGTRFTPANPKGDFVHVKYPLGEPFALRGSGPLQLAGAAISVAVEAQAWAAQFYADGGNGGTIIKAAGFLAPGEEGDSEAEKLRAQWVGRPNNVPRVIDSAIESITNSDVNPQGAQMLDARGYQNGDAARMFGIPGALLEYVQSGTSLTYRTEEGIWSDFLRGCLSPLYLEPIEQAISDLLPRSTKAAFDRAGLLQADVKTRADVYNTLIPLRVLTVEEARAAEGLAPGNAEYAAVPPSPPSAVPSRLSLSDEPTRCSRCGKARFLVKGGQLHCIACRAVTALERAGATETPVRIENHIHLPERASTARS